MIGKETASFGSYMQNDVMIQICEGFVGVLYLHFIPQPCSCFCRCSTSLLTSFSAIQFPSTGKELLNCVVGKSGAQEPPTDDSNIFRQSISLKAIHAQVGLLSAIIHVNLAGMLIIR